MRVELTPNRITICGTTIMLQPPLVPPPRIERRMVDYQSTVIPFNYRGILVAGDGFEPPISRL